MCSHLPCSGPEASLSWFIFIRRVGQISDHDTLFCPLAHPTSNISCRQSCATLSYTQQMSTERQLAWLWNTKPCCLLISYIQNFMKNGESSQLSLAQLMRRIPGSTSLTYKLCRQAGAKKAKDPNHVHHQKYHVIPYCGAGFPLSLKELKEPRARSSLEETRCFSCILFTKIH